MPGWICCRTHPNNEKIAIRNLINQDFSYYQPLIQERKIRRKKLHLVEQPLFPCYLFVRVEQQYRSLNYTYGIAALISGIVRDAEIDNLKRREVNGYVQLPKPKKYEIGDKVMINQGAFAGQQALVERMNVKDRQRILLGLLNGSVKALVNEDEIEIAA